MIRRTFLAAATATAALLSEPRTLIGQAKGNALPEKAVRVEPTPHVVMRVRAVRPDRIGIGETVYLDIDSLAEAIRRDRIDPHDFVLYLNGRPLWNVRGTLVSPTTGTLAFRLRGGGHFSRSVGVFARESKKSCTAWNRNRRRTCPGTRIGVGRIYPTLRDTHSRASLTSCHRSCCSCGLDRRVCCPSSKKQHCARFVSAFPAG